MRVASILVLSALSSLPLLSGEVGISATQITIGQVAPLEGPAKGLGMGMHLGLKAALTAANSAGGINGRQIELIAINDGYEPDKTVEATGQLIEEKNVFALCGYVGTPTSKVAIPMAEEAKVPLIGIFSGAGILRKPELTQVVNMRASYDQETEALVERLTTDLNLTRIGVMYQNDAFGQAGLSGTEKALTKRKLAVVKKASFERNTVAVKNGLAELMADKPEAVIVVGPYKPVATFAKEANAVGFKPLLATISFVGTEALISEGGTDVEGMVISQVVPSPRDVSVPTVKAYHTALAAVDATAKPGYISFEGYLTGKTLIAGLSAAGAEPTRAGLLSALAALKGHDLGGLTVTWDATSRQLSPTVWMTQIRSADAVSVTTITAR